MGFNSFPCNPYPISTEELNKGNNDALNTRVTALEGDVIDLEEQKANQITIALPFNPETTYEVGDLVYYNGLSYRCTNEHTGEWDAGDFAGTTIANELSALKSGLTNVGNYSTSEVNTGMKWIDGRDIFKKVISCGALPNTTQMLVSSGLSNITVLPPISGVAIGSSGIIPLPFASSANKNVQLHYSTGTNQVAITTTEDLTSYTESYVVLLYVKNNP